MPALRARREDIPLLVEHFRLRCNRDDQLAVDGFTREALAVLEADLWPGNVRELERVVHRAMAVRRRGLVRPEDVRLPALRRTSPAVPASTAGTANPAPTATLTRDQAEALRLAAADGEVRRGDLMARCGISTESARRSLASLVELGLLRRLGRGRGAWYVLRKRTRREDEQRLRGNRLGVEGMSRTCFCDGERGSRDASRSRRA